MSRTIQLPPPQKDLGFPLMKALEQRRTKRKWAQIDFTNQELSNLLWAACGITQQETTTSKSKRTAPSASNSQEITVYIALSIGLFLYDEKHHQLIEIFSEDIREHIGTQKIMKTVPVGLIYVSDFSKFQTFLYKDDTRKWLISSVDTGLISQNVYLYAAAANFNTALLGLVDRDALHQIMGLQENEKIIFTQAIGKGV